MVLRLLHGVSGAHRIHSRQINVIAGALALGDGLIGTAIFATAYAGKRYQPRDNRAV